MIDWSVPTEKLSFLTKRGYKMDKAHYARMSEIFLRNLCVPMGYRHSVES